MEVSLALLADYSNVSREGKLNILGIFTQLRALKVPAQHPSLQLIVQFNPAIADRGREHQIEINCMGPDGGELIFELKASFLIPSHSGSSTPPSINQILDIKNLTFKEFGGHTFSIFVDNDLKTQVPLDVIQLEPPSADIP